MYEFKNPVMFESVFTLNDNQIFPNLCVMGEEPQIVPPANSEPGIVYHYCNNNAFTGILENECFWLSSLFYTNDEMESSYFFNLFNNYVQKYQINQEWADFFIKMKNHFRINIDEAFSVSFSNQRDDKNQWILYSDDCQGYSIGIDTTQLTLTRGLPQRLYAGMVPDCCTAFLKINYDVIFHEAQIEKLLTKMFEEKFPISDICHFLSKLAFVFKSDWYKTENEYRILYTPGMPEVLGDMPGGIDSSNGFISERRKRKNKISDNVSYFCYSFEKSLIKEIGIGPKNNISIEQVKSLLIEMGYDTNNINIYKSRGAYR
ncbi:MAG: hypothetical protein R3Y28_03420 [Candidatus Gastranaerophilales bacterium]